MTAVHDPKETQREFREVINMTLAALRRWLETDESNSVGMTPGGERVTAPGKGEAVAHHMGERILELKETPAAKLTPDDYADMRKVVGYVHRHMVQRPAGDIGDSRWRKSLMNWGHDPMK